MTVQDDDQFLVSRSSTPYNLKTQNLMAELLDTDLMVVSRSGVPYKATGLEIKDSITPANAPPSITSVTLADDSTGGDRFDSSSFTSTLNWATKGYPEASLAMKATVTGTLDIAGTTDEITAITTGSQTFKPVAYSGNGSSQSITTGFSPGLVWFKQRSGTEWHYLFDSIRGADKALFSNVTNGEYTVGANMGLSFDSNGFSVGSDSAVNGSGETYVAWTWKANGAAVSNTDGTITSSVSANQTHGFSIATFNSPSSGNFTFGTGLNAVPKVVIVKTTGATSDWSVYHASVTDSTSKYLVLNSNAALATYSTVWGAALPTSTVVGLTSGGSVATSQACVAYSWSEVAGYSKFGSYTGNGSNTGPVITTTFAPAFVMIKRTDSAGTWAMYDTARDPSNPADTILRAQSSSADSTNAAHNLDFLSTGFQLKTTETELNTSGGTYIYMAFGAGSPDSVLTLASDANLANGVFQAGDSVKQNNSPIVPTSSAITNVTGNVLTLTNSDGLSDFTVGDVVQSGWDQSEIWSNNITISTASGGSVVGSPTDAFNGTIWSMSNSSNSGYSNDAIGSSITFAPTAGTLVGRVVKLYQRDRPSNVTVNGTAATITTSGNTRICTVDLGSSQNITSVVTTATTDGQTNSFSYIEVDNKLLVDTGLPDPNAISITAINSSTPSITTNGGTWTAGDVVTGPSTSITATYVSADAAAKTMTVSSLVGPWSSNTNNFVENTVVNPIQIKPETSAITTVTGNVLTLTDDTDLAQFAVGANVYPDPPAAPSFAPVAYSGNGGTQSITTGFSPGLVWIKNRDDSAQGDHRLYDIVRGATKEIYSNLTAAEATEVNGLSAFTSNGFSVGSINAVNGSSDGLVAWAWNAGENSNKTYAITVANPGSGNKYFADSAQQPTLTLAEGSTYKFDQSNATNATHPLKLSTTSDGTHGGGSEYTTGVTTVGTPGSAGAYTQVVIAASAPTLYTYCTAHSGMGFQINTSDTAGYTIPAGSLNSTAYDQSAVWSSGTFSPAASYAGSEANAFNGQLAAQGGYFNGGGTWTPSSAYTFYDKVEILDSVDQKYAINGGTQVAINIGSWTTIASTTAAGGATLTTINFTRISDAATTHTWKGLRIDGKLLVDSGVTVGSVPAVASRVQANPSAGFSIVSYTGTGAVGTVGHGLNNAVPELVIVKCRSHSQNWVVQHSAYGPTKYTYLNSTNEARTTGAAAFWDNTAPTNSTVSVGTDNDTNASGRTYVAYCWSEISGYSKFSSYTGTGNSGLQVTTGFRPAFVMIKRTDTNGSWTIFDTARDDVNPVTLQLYANESASEVNGSTDIINWQSNGFSLAYSGGSLNQSGGTYIYMAFAEGGGPTGVVGSISNLDMTLSASTGTWEVGQKVTKDIGPAIEATANLIFNSSGAVSGLTTQDVAGQLMTDKDAPKLTFAAGPGTGDTWDQELPAGTHLQTSFVATNVEGTSSATSNEITPS